MKVRFKKLHPNAVTPTKAHPTDAGFDLVAVTDGQMSETDYFTEYGTGIAVELPAGCVGLIFPRSSISKVHQSLSNSVGVIDSGYRGEIKLRFRDIGAKLKLYKKGDKIGQLIILQLPFITLEETDELSEADRGTAGFGSSGI